MRTVFFGHLLLLLLASGYAFPELHTAQMARLRAGKAWHEMQVCPDLGPAADDFERGWKKGYFDVSTGGDGCAPPVAPKCYWSFKYQSPEGQQQIEAWFAGYRSGAEAGLVTGHHQWAFVPTSKSAGHGSDMPLIVPHNEGGPPAHLLDGEVLPTPHPLEESHVPSELPDPQPLGTSTQWPVQVNAVGSVQTASFTPAAHPAGTSPGDSLQRRLPPLGSNLGLPVMKFPESSGVETQRRAFPGVGRL